MIYKGLSYLIVLLSLSNISSAQSNYFRSTIALGVGPNYSYTDVNKGNWGYTAYGAFDVNLSPFFTVGLEAQFGKIKGGNIETDPHNRQYLNNYSAITANVKLMLGEIINYDESDFLYSLRGLYTGLGIGVVNNNIVDIVRFKPSYADNPGYGPFPGADKSLNLMVPINLGINFFIVDDYGYTRYAINLNAQSNIAFGEGLDGYNDPPTVFKNYSPDIFNSYTIGVKYYFGNTKAYRKTL